MLRTRLAPLFGVVLMALASAELTTPPKPSCVCAFNTELHQNELLCQGTKGAEEALSIVDLAKWNCRSFAKLDVSNHDVVSIPDDAFATAPHLQVVVLSSDAIRSIGTEAFGALRALVSVDLGDNVLVSVDADLFANNPVLTKVSLAENPLVELEENSPLLNSDSITDLDLSFCKLTKLTPETFSGLPSLRKLDLSSNSIQQMSLTALEAMPKLASLDIGNNRWECGCAFRDVLEYSRSLMPESTTVFPKVRCFSPGKQLEVWSDKSAKKYDCPAKVAVEDSEEYEYDDQDSSSEEELEDVLYEQQEETTQAVDRLEDKEQLERDTKIVVDKTNALIEATKKLTEKSSDLLEDSYQVDYDSEELLETVLTETDEALKEDSKAEPTENKSVPSAEDAAAVNEISIVLVAKQGGGEGDWQMSYFFPGVLVLVLSLVVIVGLVVTICKLKKRQQNGDWALLLDDAKEEALASAADKKVALT